MIYYAIFRKLEKSWGVHFPDISGIHTEGKDMNQAIHMASDALSGMLVVGRKGRDYQEPNTFEEIKAQAAQGEIVIPVQPDEKLMNSYRPKKRINVMFPVDLLARVDQKVKASEGLDRSKFFRAATEHYLAEKR